MDKLHAVFYMGCLCGMMTIIFGIIGSTGNDLALFMSYLYSGGSALLMVAGLIMGIIEGFKS